MVVVFLKRQENEWKRGGGGGATCSKSSNSRLRGGLAPGDGIVNEYSRIVEDPDLTLRRGMPGVVMNLVDMPSEKPREWTPVDTSNAAAAAESKRVDDAQKQHTRYSSMGPKTPDVPSGKNKEMNMKDGGASMPQVQKIEDVKRKTKKDKVKLFQPRQRTVPANSFSRAFGFAGLGASLLWGTAQESVKKVFTSKKSEGKKGNAPHSLFLTKSNAERLANALCHMRGAALKLGQMISIQDENILPPEFQEALERVRAGADVMPQKQLESVLKAELGDNWRAKLLEFNDMPLAAASIGQVHAATMHNGKEVVMKIQYPGVAESIESDVGRLT